MMNVSPVFDIGYVIAGILPSLVLLAVVIGALWYFIRRRDKGHPFSKEDAISQWFLLLSVFFFGITLSALNRDFGDPLSFRAVVLITSVAGLAVSYYFKLVSALVFSLIGIVFWWSAQSVHWAAAQNIKGAASFAGLMFLVLLFYVLGYFHDKQLGYRRFGFVYSFFGIISVTIALFVLSSKPGLSAFSGMTDGVMFFATWEITAFLGMVATILAVLTAYVLGKGFMLQGEALAVFIFVFLFGLPLFLSKQVLVFDAGHTGGLALTPSGILWAIVFNFAAFFELLGLIFLGYYRKEERLVNMGVFALFIFIFIKYFDWFFSFLDKSLFFIGAGILLFGIGYLMERSRRIMVSNIEKGG